MIELPDVTLIGLTGIGHKSEAMVDALHYSDFNGSLIRFGAVKYIQLGSIKDIDSWNEAVIYELPKYVETSHALLIHQDGYVVNPELWNPGWLNLDYIGAPWPLPQDEFSYRDESGKIQRVGNSVSLRSKKLMDLVAKTPKDYFWSFKEIYGNTNEDGYICCHNRQYLESLGCKFADFEQALHFSKEHELPENKGLQTFAFHEVDR